MVAKNKAAKTQKIADFDTEVRELAALIAHPDNPRIHPDSQIAKMLRGLESYGFYGNIVVQTDTDYILKGHGVVEMLLKDGYTHARVIPRQIEDAMAKAFIIYDNKIGELSAWNMPKLDANFADLADMGVDLEETAFEMEEIRGFGSTEVEEDDFDVDGALEEEPITQMGDLWLLSNHRVLCGDSTRREDVERLMDGEKATGVFTSPPYAEQREEQYGGIPTAEYLNWWEKVQANIKRIVAGNGSFFVNIKEHCENGERVLYVKDIVLAMKRKWGWKYIDEFCWLKKSAPPGGWDFRFKNRWEPIFHFSIGVPRSIDHEAVGTDLREATLQRIKYKPSGKSSTKSGFESTQSAFEVNYARATNVVETACASGENAGIQHPAMYPIALPSFFIQAFSGNSDIWLDPFLGSGTTLIACDKLDRKCAGLEISPAYCDVTIKRYINHVGHSEDVFVERDGKRIAWRELQ